MDCQSEYVLRYKLVIEYDGTPFVGWQRQKDGLSVQEVLEKALTVCLRENITIFGSGRTDTGVHAKGQVAHFDCGNEINCFKVRESLNALVRPHPISIIAVEHVSDTFHARFDAKQRTYIYRILNTRYPPALEKNRVWWYSKPLDDKLMNQAGQLLIGKHDFSTFRASECQAKSPVKTIDYLKIARQGDEVIMTIKARSFLHHQVRNIIGSLVNVGNGKWSVENFKAALEAKDRKAGGQTAPACGLYFVTIQYDENK